MKIRFERVVGFLRYVDRRICEIEPLFEEILDQNRRLSTVTRTELDQIDRICITRERFIDSIGLFFEYLKFRAGEVIFRQLHDLHEKPRALIVVKISRRKAFGLGAQAFQNIFGKLR